MTKLSVESFIDEQRVSSFQLLTLFLCFLVVAIDGFDTAAVGYVAPALSKDWGITPAELTPLMMVGLFGLMIGALLFGPLSDRYGRKKLLLGTVAIFGVTSLLSGFVDDMTQLIILRFATGLGLGGAMPNAIMYCRHRLCCAECHVGGDRGVRRWIWCCRGTGRHQRTGVGLLPNHHPRDGRELGQCHWPFRVDIGCPVRRTDAKLWLVRPEHFRGSRIRLRHRRSQHLHDG